MDANEILMRVQRRVEERWLSTLRRDIRSIEHLQYIHVLPVRRSFSARTASEDMGECTVCQESVITGEEFVVLPCNPVHPHAFHTSCIHPWLRNHDTCPTCRGKV